MHYRSLLLLLALPALAATQTTRVIDASHPDSLGERLFQAVQNGKVETVRVLLAKGANPNGSDASGGPYLAFLGGTPEEMLAVAKLLVVHGAKVDPPLGTGNQTPLLNALNRAQEPIGLVRFLLEKGADPNRTGDFGFTALDFAVRNGFAASAAALLAHGASVDAHTKEPDLARSDDPGLRQDVERSRLQIAHVFEPGYRESGQTPVFGLAQRFDPATAALILKAGAKIDEQDDNGWTPLHHAVQFGNVAAIRGLLALGANPNAASRGGFTPLHLALRTGFGLPNATVAQILLKGGADPKRRNHDGQTPLDLLRADTEWRLGNPSHDPQLALPEAMRAPYIQNANAVARVLEPKAAPIVFVPKAPDAKGARYTPLGIGDVIAVRTVRVESGHAVLELSLPTPSAGPSTLTIRAVSLENYDTVTPLPVVVRRTKGRADTVRLEFPLGAARGGAVEMDYVQQGPGSSSGSGTVGNGREANVGFAYGRTVAVEHDLQDRTLEFEILSVTRGGKVLPGFAGRVLHVEGGRPAPIVGLRVDPSDEAKRPKTLIHYRYRFLPNVRWRTDEMSLN